MRRQKVLWIVFCLFYSSLSFGQENHIFRGTLVDSTGQGVAGAIVVLMNRSDSTQLKLDYFQTSAFELTCPDSIKRELLLYISVIGYNSRYLAVDRLHPDLGKIMMTPLSVYMDEVTVSARPPIGHEFERGRDKYTIPEWLGESQYDVTSLMALIPGLAVVNGTVEIAGIGKPIYMINGLPPRMGELENLNPKDIEKVTIIRMPGAKFGSEVIGIIDIETKKVWYDYLNVRLTNDFRYTNEVNDRSAVSINFRKNKWYHFLNYSYDYSPRRTEYWEIYETNIAEEDIDYVMSSNMDTYEKTKTHSVLYAPEFRITKYSFVDLQYMFSTADAAEDNLTGAHFADGSAPDLLSRALTDAGKKTQYAILRYDNRFDNDEKRRLTFNTVYMKVKDDRENVLEEESSLSGRPIDTTFTSYWQTYNNEVLTSSLDYKFTLWDALRVETGASYGNLWIKSGIDYYTKDYTTQTRTRNEQVNVYVNADHSIGGFNYQFGLRGEYEYQHNTRKNKFYFLPSAGFSYRVNDELNFMLYYRRMVVYPTASQLNPNILYFNKYMYNTGNPSLKPTVDHSLMARMAFPFRLGLTCTYDYKKDDIATCHLPDENDAKILNITQANLDKTHLLNLDLSWNQTFGFYYLNLNTGYTQYFVKSRMVDKDSRFRPQFRITSTHYFTINPCIQARIYMHYQSASDYYYTYQRRLYAITPELSFSLLKRQLNIRITGNGLLNGGNYYTKGKYGNTLSTSEISANVRGISFGISYNFNNFIDFFQKNDSGEDLIKRAQTN